jgi:hypothetical protein
MSPTTQDFDEMPRWSQAIARGEEPPPSTFDVRSLNDTQRFHKWFALNLQPAWRTFDARPDPVNAATLGDHIATLYACKQLPGSERRNMQFYWREIDEHVNPSALWKMLMQKPLTLTQLAKMIRRK